MLRKGRRNSSFALIGKFKSLEDIREIPVNDKGLKIKDVAQVVYEVPKRDWSQRINRKQAFKIEIQKESQANTVELSRKLKQMLQVDFKQHPSLKNADIQILWSQGDMIEESINNLIDTAMWGGLFALIVIYFFLRRIRITLIMTVAIPLSVLISLICIYFIGWTLNSITMMGLMVSIGMVVDNAIVVLENIFRRRNEGEVPAVASISGASEVSLAITIATLTTIIVFVPIMLIDDPSGFFKFYMTRIGLPVIFALIASLLIALVLIPLTSTRLISTKASEEHGIIKKSKDFYRKSLRFALGHRLDTVFVILAIFAFTFFYLMPKVPSNDSNEGSFSDIRLIYDMPQNYTMEDTDEFFKEVEDSIFVKFDEYGIKAVDTGFRKNFGRIRIFLESTDDNQWYHTVYYWVRNVLGIPADRNMDKDAILADIQKRTPSPPGVSVRTSWHGASNGGDEGSVSIMLYGDDTGKLEELSKEVERRMRLIDGVISVETDREEGGDEIQVLLNREIAQKNGINPNQVAFTLMYAVRGINLPRFQTDNKEVEVRVQLKEEDRENLEQVKNMRFINRSGKAVPLSALARFNIQKGFGQIPRENGKTFLAVKAKTMQTDLDRISGQIDNLMADFQLPYGYTWQKGSRFRRMQEQNNSFGQAMLVSVVFVYLIMGILFESAILPLSVLIAIPLSLFGAYLFLYITGTSQDIMAGIGMVILVGVVVNNAIVLIDMINRRREEGYSRYDAILDAGTNRFRPIMMTSFTTIGGLLPMALGNSSLIGIPYAPLGITLIGGLFTSTFLTLLAVPVLYTLFDDLNVFGITVISWFRKEKTQAQPEIN